ncbi:protein-L-isoaspartate O-methyltransferase [Thiomicrorhabdus immobilis]|uniref:Protein-L-isoaspartate O-methyltransferase n=1 Tax=Thiomicrorhabdus immobilis TaxID=2791037 RepID=A0ABM7MEF5_9GAMM|nr:protein-L-isoaspartate O-methyltransferase [Thiomicrorhabdus immobilis]BCN93786.1 protein-L-isoaspartate O-methyltransferase [Thiomicrorhabdus immobilis]
MNLDQARFFMVEQQIRPWDVLDPKILDLLMDIPRHLFVEAGNEALAYSDIELPIGHNQTMMAPKIEGRLLQALDIDENDTVLEIGTGSGYMTALMANLGKSVTTVELHQDILDIAKARLEDYTNIEFACGDASQGWNDGKQYDAIVLTGSTQTVPQSYKEQLTLGGRLAVITGESPAMSAQVITRISDQEWETETLFETDLAPLTNANPESTFAF